MWVPPCVTDLMESTVPAKLPTALFHTGNWTKVLSFKNLCHFTMLLKAFTERARNIIGIISRGNYRMLKHS